MTKKKEALDEGNVTERWLSSVYLSCVKGRANVIVVQFVKEKSC
jgi:hypothetical protein